MPVTRNRRIVLAARPLGEPKDENFRLEEVSISPPAEGEVLLRTIYLSLDPYQRGRMDAGPSYAPSVEVGQVMEGGTVSEVVESKADDLRPGDLVLGYTGWQEYAIASGKALRKIDPARAPISTALGVLGMPGMTAYTGLLNIGRPKAGETVVVSSAAGSGIGGGPNCQDPWLPRGWDRRRPGEEQFRCERTGFRRVPGSS